MRNFWRRKRNRVMLIAAILCLLLSCLCLRLITGLNEQDTDQDAAGRWEAGGLEFTQMSVFFSPQENWQESDRTMLLSQLRMSFQENSIANQSGEEEKAQEEENGQEGLVKDCFSCETKLTLSNGTKSAQAAVTATGGDFFYFHPQLWLSGYAYSEEDVMKDRVVLDKELAWNLFGSSQVEGMPLKINNQTFYVAGVVDIRKDDAAKASYGESNRAWISYDALSAQSTDTALSGSGQAQGDSSAQGAKPPITAYEIVMPNPVTGWAKETLTNILMPQEREIVMLENSERADLLKIYTDIGQFSRSTMVTAAVKFPYWENAARIRDCKRQLFLALATFFILYPFLLCIFGIRKGYLFMGKKIEQLRKKF